ncbi:lipopolysaccharide cholinephosphotransferase [Lachnospiraceae bacterium XPB1003]|nr:lipopolysaccharide cholinephosphotransferase [Lachnospiraceae bacterium XPB1003]
MIELPEEFYREEVRNGHTVSASTKKIWAVELELLSEFDRVCRECGLPYYADQGTLLGTVRHGGFIPWDDDIDLIMFRKDYDRLIHECGDKFKEPFFLQTAYSEKDYFRGHAQLRKSDTCAAIPSEAYTLNINQGIFLDIFVMDNIPEGEAELEKTIKILNDYHDVMSIMTQHDIKGSFLKKLRCRLGILKRRIKFGNVLSVYKKTEKVVKNIPDTGYVDKLLFWHDAKSVKKIRSEWYEKTEYLEFENTKLPVPYKYDEVLKAQFGENYMTPIKGTAFHPNLIIDTERSYKEVLGK